MLALGVGTVALVKGTGVAVTPSLALARHFDISENLVKMFVLSAGTNLTEIGTHLVASFGVLGGWSTPSPRERSSARIWAHRRPTGLPEGCVVRRLRPL